MPDDMPIPSNLESVFSEDHQELLAIVNQQMPFGRFQGRRLIELPEPYLVWFKGEGFPRGKLGERMAVMYEIKANGIERLLQPLVGAELDAQGRLVAADQAAEGVNPEPVDPEPFDPESLDPNL